MSIAARGSRDARFVGHRGARFEAPENTIPGFRYAIRLGLSAVELDVRMTADEKLVVIHDASVDRTTDGVGMVSALRLDQAQRLDARAIFPDWPEECRVPTLGNVLDVVRGLPDLIVEIKPDPAGRLEQIAAATVSEVRDRNIEDRVTITSFDPVALAVVQREAPSIRRGYIGDWNTPEFLDRSLALGCRQADIHHPSGNRELAARAKALGLRIICWPVNSLDELVNAMTFEPDLFCTDRPTLARSLYEQIVGEPVSGAGLPG